MRKLNGGDLFAAFRAMRKIDLSPWTTPAKKSTPLA